VSCARAVAAAALALALAASGCAQVLGLDPTERRDGGGLCAVDLECTGADRTVCGRLIDAITEQPFAAPGATGAACVPGATDGPCAFTIGGVAASELFLGGGAPVPSVYHDDCGRFRIEAMAGDDLAVTAVPGNGAELLYRSVARTILYTDTGTVEDVAVPMISEAQVTVWETQAPAGTEVTDGFLLRFRNGGDLIQRITVRVDANQIPDPPATPYALYFAGAQPFATVIEGAGDASALRGETGPTGTAYLQPDGAAAFSVGGTRPGSQCDSAAVGMINSVPGFLVWVELINC
jgi:hypothetical protein